MKHLIYFGKKCQFEKHCTNANKHSRLFGNNLMHYCFNIGGTKMFLRYRIQGNKWWWNDINRHVSTSCWTWVHWLSCFLIVRSKIAWGYDLVMYYFLHVIFALMIYIWHTPSVFNANFIWDIACILKRNQITFYRYSDIFGYSYNVSRLFRKACTVNIIQV